jgi:hypothetical protein
MTEIMVVIFLIGIGFLIYALINNQDNHNSY